MIRAKTDIYTPDGTLRYKAGQTVGTLISSATKTVYSDLLYLGDYEILEVSGANGFVREETARDVSLVYRGEMTVSFDVTETFDNRRGQVELTLEKQMEAMPGSGDKPYHAVKYGLYAAQDLTDYLGNAQIRKGDLMEIITLGDTGKYSSQKAMVWGEYYVKELATGELYQLDQTEYPVSIWPDTPTKVVKTIAVTEPDGKSLTNMLNRARIKVIKTDGETKTPLPGVTFEVIGSDAKVVTSIVTGEDGTAETGLLPVSNQPYIIWEKSTLKEYVLDDTPREILLTEHEKVYELALENVKIRGRIRIFKFTDKDTPVRTRRLPGRCSESTTLTESWSRKSPAAPMGTRFPEISSTGNIP